MNKNGRTERTARHWFKATQDFNVSAERGEGRRASEGEQGGWWCLTLEVKSLLVHSDGECAVVLVIDSYHSPLDKWSGLERERETHTDRERERGRHTPTFHFYRHACHSPTFQAAAFHKLPAVVPGC